MIKNVSIEESKLKDNIIMFLKILDEHKAENLTYIDLNELSAVANEMIIATALSEIHSKSLLKNIVKILRNDFKIKPTREEGGSKGKWIVLDFTDLMLHIMVPEIRELYNLEDLWPDGKIYRIKTEL